MTEKEKDSIILGQICKFCQRDPIMNDGGWLIHIINHHWDIIVDNKKFNKSMREIMDYFYNNKVYSYSIFKEENKK